MYCHGDFNHIIMFPTPVGMTRTGGLLCGTAHHVPHACGDEPMTGAYLLTTVVGSYPQPEWLIDRQALGSGGPPRIRLSGLWRIPEEHLEEAQDDATLIAIRDMQRAGVDIITDGEMRRESYSNRFATALDGIDIETPAVIKNRAGVDTVVPRAVGKVRRRAPVEVRDMEFLRRNT